MEILLFFLVGIFSGISAGLLGIGGGLISVPAMIYLLPILGVADHNVMHTAVATSLLVIIPTSIISAYGHLKFHVIGKSTLIRIMFGLIIGGVVGVMFALVIERNSLQFLFAIFLLLVVINMLIGKQPSAGSRKKYYDFPVGMFIGGISSLMGVGGGTMSVPYFISQGLDAHKAVAYAAVCGVPIAITGSLVFYLAQWLAVVENTPGYFYMPALIGLTAGSVLFAPLGVKISHNLNVKCVKQIFMLVLLTISLNMLFSS